MWFLKQVQQSVSSFPGVVRTWMGYSIPLKAMICNIGMSQPEINHACNRCPQWWLRYSIWNHLSRKKYLLITYKCMGFSSISICLHLSPVIFPLVWNTVGRLIVYLVPGEISRYYVHQSHEENKASYILSLCWVLFSVHSIRLQIVQHDMEYDYSKRKLCCFKNIFRCMSSNYKDKST